jgi:hypothetical protein
MKDENDWITLTDDEIDGLARRMGIKLTYDMYRMVRAAEEVLREKNDDEAIIRLFEGRL